MEPLFAYYYEIFDLEVKKNEGVLTAEVEATINNTGVALKNTFISSPNYIEICCYIDKLFYGYIIENTNHE